LVPIPALKPDRTQLDAFGNNRNADLRELPTIIRLASTFARSTGGNVRDLPLPAQIKGAGRCTQQANGRLDNSAIER
jgi:hypothetical protein